MPLVLWNSSYSRRSGFRGGAAFSIVVHSALITASVLATLPRLGVPEGSLGNRVYYLPPPAKHLLSGGSRESVQFVELAPPGQGAGFGIGAARADQEPTASAKSVTPHAGDTGTDSTTRALFQGPSQDSVFTIVEVDSAAKRAANSAVPRYPQSLLELGIDGKTLVQFVVDTFGLAEVESFKVVNASHNEFALAVLEALPGMRFTPARIGDARVRQLVEMPFTFQVEKSSPEHEKGAKRPP